VTLEQSGTSPKKVRGRAKGSTDLITAMRDIAEAAQPITGRGVGYKLFVAKLIPSMSRKDMRKVYRLLLLAREEGIIPWHWIVDETRYLEKVATWDDTDEFARDISNSFRRDFWNQQPVRVEVWSEKGTVRGVVAPVLNQYGVGFRVVHGYSGATPVVTVARSNQDRPLIILYIGDWDPSGMNMSEHDLPNRFKEYGGEHIELMRIALTGPQVLGLPSFPATDKKGDTRYKWFCERYGDRCWELDAMDPNDLRDCVEKAIKELIEPVAWERCEVAEEASRKSFARIVRKWSSRRSRRRRLEHTDGRT
jgi:hypothetical protein